MAAGGDRVTAADPAFLCMDCRFDTQEGDEYYCAHDEVWEAAVPRNHRRKMLCIGCLEKRLGRTLTRRDFKDCALTLGIFPMSERLQSRLSNL